MDSDYLFGNCLRPLNTLKNAKSIRVRFEEGLRGKSLVLDLFSGVVIRSRAHGAIYLQNAGLNPLAAAGRLQFGHFEKVGAAKKF